MQSLFQSLPGRQTGSSTSNRELQESKEYLTCSICMDLYNDAKLLSCSHTFCTSCLVSYQSDSNGSKACPKCRQMTVPPLNRIRELPGNEFVNNVVRLIRNHEEKASNLVETDAVENHDDIFVGELIPETDQRPTVRSASSRKSFGLSVLAGTAIGVLTGGVSGVISAAAIIGGSYVAIEAYEKNARDLAKERFVCSTCQSEHYATRYKCGMCVDFTMCPHCFDSPDHMRLHDPNHIFLKLNGKIRRDAPAIPLLKDKAQEIAESFDYTCYEHKKTFIHTPERLIKLPGIQCKGCGQQPIINMRYKCGQCRDYDLCETCMKKQKEFHEGTHVFMVIRYHAEINVISEPLLKAVLY